MRLLVHWYDGNENYTCLVETIGPFAIDEAIIKYLHETPEHKPENWTGDVDIQIAIEIPESAFHFRGLPPMMWKREDESYPVHVLDEEGVEASTIPYYDLRG
jgi:hypothetical protein